MKELRKQLENTKDSVLSKNSACLPDSELDVLADIIFEQFLLRANMDDTI